VDLTLTSDNDPDLCALTDRIREETFPNSKGWYRLGELLFKMGQSDKAQQVYEVLLEQASSDSDEAYIYSQLGAAKDDQGEYKEAITFYEQALEINQKFLPPNHPSLATSYNNIGLVYDKMGDYPRQWFQHPFPAGTRRKRCLSGVFPAGSAHIPAGTCRKNIGTRKQYSGPENHRTRKRVFPAGS
jgi:tetratricopeptide (TPR) repeat protein